MTHAEICGQTSVYGLIGNPVAHSLSPLIHNRLAELSGVNSVYAAFCVENASALAAAVKGAHSLGINGLNVTAPYKKSIMEHLQELDESAKKTGAVNTIKRTGRGFTGFNTDLDGILKTYDDIGINFGKNPPLIIGAGGAAYSAAFACAERGATRIFIVNRTNNNSELLATQIKKYYNIIVNVVSYDEIRSVEDGYFIIQTTPVGMSGYSGTFPVNIRTLVGRACGVFDMVYSPAATELLAESKRVGKIGVNGMQMLVYQAVRAFEIWNGRAVCKSHISELLGSVV